MCRLSTPPKISRLSAILAVLVFSSCEKQTEGILDSVGGPPVILSSSLVPSTVNTDTINVGPERKPEDVLPIKLEVLSKVFHPEGMSEIGRVQVSVYKEKQQPTIVSAILTDSGVQPDMVAGDSTYSAHLTVQLPRSEIGVYNVEFFAESRTGLRSTVHLLPLTIVRLNQPPILSNLQAPDTVRTSTENSFLITVDALDPDGLADIRSVVRRTPSNLVLQLNDSGVNGDVSAADGVFSETVSLTPPPPAGSYTFTFQAFDRSNAESNILSHTIIVVP